MKVELKRLREGKWSRVPAEEILHKSMAQFVSEEFDRVVAKVNITEKKILYICNDEKDIKAMDARIAVENEKLTVQKKPLIDGFSLHVNDVIDFLGSQISIPIVAKTFPDAEFMELNKLEPEKE